MRSQLVNARAIELYVAGDGQRFTDLIRSWAKVYLRRCGASNLSVSGVAWRPDGGVDGLIDDQALYDPLGWFMPQTVMQFKAGSTSLAAAKKELLDEAAEGEERVRDKIEEGFRLVWFIGRDLADLNRQAFEDALAEIVSSINEKAPRPIVIDANRFKDLLSLTPAVALRVASNEGLFNTTDAALMENPHNKLPQFVPGAHYEQLRTDVIDFFLAGPEADQIKYIAGEPGIGKSRSILEAVESSDELKGTVCYFYDPTHVGDFLSLAKQEGWKGCAIVDEYIGESRTTTPINGENVPSGFKILLIGHAYATDRLSPRITNRLDPLTEEEVKNALAATFRDLPEFRILDAVRMSKNNIRLARVICDHYRKHPDSEGLDADSLSRIVTEELQRMPSGRDVLKRLALVPNLLSEETTEFCKLVEYDEAEFRSTCRQISASSALIQFNDHVAYIGSPAVAQLALKRLWLEDQELAKRVLANPGQFAERILVAINKLPAGADKEAMLDFFPLPVAKLRLTDLLDGTVGRRFLNLLTADPDTYLPVLSRLVRESRGTLDQFPYEGTAVGRRDVIWRLRDLAQFAEYFEPAEEIVYAFAREEAKSAYANTASSYWRSWFHSYFDHTTYPYEWRLDLLENRARHGDDIDRELVIQALSDPFPHHGDAIPSSRVGGRTAPPELNFIHHHQIRSAALRIPGIVRILLNTTPEIASRTANMVLQGRFSWLEHGALEAYAEMVADTGFPVEAKKRLVADTRQYIDLAADRTVEPDERVKWMHKQHERLLKVIDDPDPVIEVLEVAEHGMWRGDEPGTAANAKLTALMDRCLADPQLFKQAVEILCTPDKKGGGSFGRLLGPRISDEQLELILKEVQQHGLSQFSFSAIGSAAKMHPERQTTLLDFAVRQEAKQPHVALGIYQLFGDETYYREAARMIESPAVDSRLFRGFFLRSAQDIPDEVWAFVSAISRRAASGDENAIEVLATVVGELARNNVEDERAFAIAMPALEHTPSDHSRNAMAEWSDIALWLYQRLPEEVIRLAASREQSEFSEATTALAEIAKTWPEAVLEALVPKLANPYEAPFLLHGGLLRVFQNVPERQFTEWLEKQDGAVIETVAGHLPKPFLVGGKAQVPALTRAFWDVCRPELNEVYEHAQSSFDAHTFSTGVFWGYGVDLFTERVEIAKQLMNDPNPGIREWADLFHRQSQAMLDDAIRSMRIAEARQATSD